MAKILVVDDDPDIVESITMVLEKNNYDVIQAYGGVDGINKAKEYRPDGIILDVMMPDKNGYDVCKELKNDKMYQDIPIMLLTAVMDKMPSTSYTMRGGMETQADDYVDKPIALDELVGRVENLLK